MKVKSNKILEVITSLITSAESITGVIQRGEFFYFMTGAKHLWLIRSKRNETQLHLILTPTYRSPRTHKELMSNNGQYFIFSSLDYETPIFDELYEIIQSRVNGLEYILNQTTKTIKNEN